jgi:outer membrane putative beta-barrel porin/alpha-amylase
MDKQPHLRHLMLVVLLWGTLITVARSEARELNDALVKGYVGLAPFFSGGTFCPCAFAQNLSNALSIATSQTITQNVPVASVAPAFSYRYNPALNVFERSTTMLGPMFAERALTIGKGNLNFNIGYSYVGFDDINGSNLDHLTTDNGFFFTNQGDAAQLRTRLNVQTHVFAPTVRYGLSDNLDLSLIFPILNTSLQIRNTTVAVANQVTPNLGDLSDFSTLNNHIGNLRYVQTTPRVVGRAIRSSQSATGLGDIIIRSKYNFWRDEASASAAAFELELLLPTGDKDNLQGIRETHVTPSIIGSRVLYDLVEPHFSVGLDFNAKDVDRSSVIYDVGTTLQVWRLLVLTVDVLGRSEFNKIPVNNNGLAADGLRLDKPLAQCTATLPCSSQQAKVAIFPENFARRNDTVNFAFGLRYAVGEAGSVYFGGVLPLNDDGFRSDFIPTGGMEYTF